MTDHSRRASIRVSRWLPVLLLISCCSGAFAAKVATPKLDPSGRIFDGELRISMECSTKDAIIRYTTDGRDPSTSSTQFRGTFTIREPHVIKARAYKNGMTDSDIAKETYTRRLPKAKLEPANRTIFKDKLQVKMTCEVPGVTFYYTTDGNKPTESSKKCDGSLTIEEQTKLTVRAFKRDWEPSEPVTYEYLKLAEEVAKPVFKPGSKTFTGALMVEIECATAGATIYFTNDGKEPTRSSTKYAGVGIVVQETRTLKARAIKEGMVDSDVAEATYTRQVQQVKAPEFDPPHKTVYRRSTKIKLSCDTAGATIRYTTNGDPPTTSSKKYEGPIELDKDSEAITTIKAKAFKDGWEASEVATGVFTRAPEKVPTPYFDPASGKTFDGSGMQFGIKCDLAEATIHFTSDGSRPHRGSPIYAKGQKIFLGETSTIQAIALCDGWEPSEVAKVEYKLVPEPAPVPRIEPSATTFKNEIKVRIWVNFLGSTIRYTTDGKEPDEDSPEFKETLTLTETTTVKARVFKKNWLPSPVVQATFVKEKVRCATPKLSPEGREFKDEITVRMETRTEDATIYYTTDGSKPTLQSAQYKSPLKLTKTTTIRAVAFKEGMWMSDEAEERYTLKGK